MSQTLVQSLNILRLNNILLAVIEMDESKHSLIKTVIKTKSFLQKSPH